LYEIRQTEDRGRAVFAIQDIPVGTTVHLATHPFVCIIKDKFRKEVCAWCFTYRHGTRCPVKHSNTHAGLCFCSNCCLDKWVKKDFDSALTGAMASLRTTATKAVLTPTPYRKMLTEQYIASTDEFPLDLAMLVASAIVERSREHDNLRSQPSSWEGVLDLQSAVATPEIDLPAETGQIIPFLKRFLPQDLVPLVQSTAYPFLSRHLSNSFGIWEQPVGPDSENLGSAMYPSASYFNHACDSNVRKDRQERSIAFIASRDIREGEEICITYGDTDLDVMERRGNLKEWWGFTCTCPRCLRELHCLEKDKSIDRRRVSR
jgi:SET and MYND domain-containing protein